MKLKGKHQKKKTIELEPPPGEVRQAIAVLILCSCGMYFGGEIIERTKSTIKKYPKYFPKHNELPIKFNKQ